MMGTENTQPPTGGVSGPSGPSEHVDTTTLALLADLDLHVGPDSTISDASVDSVRRFAAELLEDDPDIEVEWRESALVGAARHIVTCTSCRSGHGSVVDLSSTHLRTPSLGSIMVDPARMEQALSAALIAFDAEIPVSHARELVTSSPVAAANSTERAPKVPWWRRLSGFNPSPSREASGGQPTRVGGAVAFLRQRVVVAAGIGMLAVIAAIVLRPSRVEQVSTVAIPATTAKPATESGAAKASDAANAASAERATDTTSPSDLVVGQVADETGAAASDTVAPISPNAVAGEATPATPEASSADGGAAASGSAIAGAPQSDTRVTTSAPPLEVAAAPEPAPATTQAAQRAKPAKKSSPTTGAATDQVPASTAVPATAVASPVVVAPSPPNAPAPTSAPSSGASTQARTSAQPSPVVVAPVGDATTNEELLTRFGAAIANDPALRSKVFAASANDPAAATAPSAGAPAPASGSTVSSTATANSASAAAVASASGSTCPSAPNQQVLATGSGTVNGRPLLLRIVRSGSANATTTNDAPSTFTEVLDPSTCNVLARQLAS